MRLLITVSGTEDIDTYLGVTQDAEFYAGFELSEWRERYGGFADLNRMSAFRGGANFDGFDKTAALVSKACGHELYITLNAGSYSKDQIRYLEDVIRELAQTGVSGIILGIPELAEIVRVCGMKACASTMLGIYNEDIAAFCAGMGFQRLILPRELTLSEIREIREAVPQVEYECFMMRNGCRYSDSFCLGRHSDRHGAICTMLDRSETSYHGLPEQSFKDHDRFVLNHLAFSSVFHKRACGACAVYDLMQAGIDAGKIVGRADGVSSILPEVENLARNIRIASSSTSRREYLDRMIMPSAYDGICYLGCNCYYPEVRYPL